MLIEYKIKFEKDGLTIAQHIQPNSAGVARNLSKVPVTGLPATQQEVTSLATRNPLAQGGASGDPFGGASGDQFGGAPGDQFGGAPGDQFGGASGDPFGGSASGFAPIFILGPIVFGHAAPENKESIEKPTPETPKPQLRKPAPKARGAAAGKRE